MLNTSIKVIATQYTDSHDGVKFERKKSQQFIKYQ